MYSIVTFYLLVVPWAYATPLQLDPPLNLPSILASRPFTVNTTAFSPDECYEPKIGRLPINFKDCQDAASQINPDFKTQFFTFGRQSSEDPNYIKLPKSYRSGTCIIYLDMLQDTDQDLLTLPMVWKATTHLANECVGQQAESALRLGGILGIPPRNLLHVVIFGRKYPVAATYS